MSQTYSDVSLNYLTILLLLIVKQMLNQIFIIILFSGDRSTGDITYHLKRTKMTYEQKEGIADKYLFRIAGTCWEDLPDINSLHNAETPEEIQDLCNERLKEDGFSFDN